MLHQSCWITFRKPRLFRKVHLFVEKEMDLSRDIKVFLFCLLLCIFGCARSQYPITQDGEGHSLAEAQAISPEDVLGIGDEIKVIVWRKDDLNRTLKIGSSGQIFFPLVGVIQSAGLTPNQLRSKITEGLSTHFVNPQVNVEISSYRSRKFYVLGEVQKAGMFMIESSASVIEAIAMAGGFTVDASLRNVILVRQESNQIEVRSLNLNAFLRSGDLHQNVQLQSRDIVYVVPTTITDISRFMLKFYTIILPLVEIERGIIYGYEISDLIQGKQSGRVVIPLK